ncbi:MAG: hypothetical protein ACYTG2_10715 [Planctomycetota bacterium]|jgi:hypothetical protein
MTDAAQDRAQDSAPVSPTLLTPVLVKAREDQAGPKGRTHYILSRDGLFLHRSHPFFTSCTPVREWPPELAGCQASLVPRFPPLSRGQYELIVGFFSRVAEQHGTEAALLLVWDREQQRARLHVPWQTALLGGLGVRYELPEDLPPHQVVYGDAHCHVDAPAYASNVDVHDEEHAAGLHLVVGRIRSDPPDLHAEVVVDGVRFPIEPSAIVAGYARRRADVPDAWMERMRFERFADRPAAGISVVPATSSPVSISAAPQAPLTDGPGAPGHGAGWHG